VGVFAEWIECVWNERERQQAAMDGLSASHSLTHSRLDAVSAFCIGIGIGIGIADGLLFVCYKSQFRCSLF